MSRWGLATSVAVLGTVILAGCDQGATAAEMREAKETVCDNLEAYLSADAGGARSSEQLERDYAEAAEVLRSGGDDRHADIVQEMADTMGRIKELEANDAVDSSDLESMSEGTESMMAAIADHVDQIRRLPEDYCDGIAELPQRG